MPDLIPPVLLVAMLLLVEIAWRGQRPTQGDSETMKRDETHEPAPGLVEAFDAAQAELDDEQTREAARLRRLLEELGAALETAAAGRATAERIHRLRELQSVARVMTELLEEENE